MSALLELPEVRERISPLSVAEYHQLGEFNENGRRTELIRGLVIQKMPKSPLHCFLLDRLTAIIQSKLAEGWIVRTDNPLTLEDSEPEPDLAVMRGNQTDYAYAHPKTAALVVEIAVSSLALDRANASLYAENSVQEYWIVLAKQRAIEVYRRPAAGSYLETRLYTEGETLVSTAVPGIEIELTPFFALPPPA